MSFPFRANALYGCTCWAHPLRRLLRNARLKLPAKWARMRCRMARLARAMIRYALSGICALQPDAKVIAPWREWELASRTKLIAYAEANQIPVPKDKRGEAPFSVDANLLHISAEGKVLRPACAGGICLFAHRLA